MAFGVTIPAIILYIIFALILIAANAGILHLFTKLFSFKKPSFKKALYIGGILGVINTVLAAFLNMTKKANTWVDILLFIILAAAAYICIKKFYNEPVKETSIVTGLLIAADIVIAVITLILLVSLITALGIPIY